MLTLNEDTKHIDIEVHVDENGYRGSVNAGEMAEIAAKLLKEVLQDAPDPSRN